MIATDYTTSSGDSKTHGHTQFCDDLRDEAREIWCSIRKLEGNN